MKIAYASHNQFILTIDVLDDISNNYDIDISDGYKNENKNTMYSTKDYKIIQIEDIYNKIYPLDTTLNMNIFNYYKTKERAYFQCVRDLYFTYFMQTSESSSITRNENYNISGIYKEYNRHGELLCEFYHNNGIIDGELTWYYSSGVKEATLEYVNGVLKKETIYGFDGNIAQIKYST